MYKQYKDGLAKMMKNKVMCKISPPADLLTYSNVQVLSNSLEYGHCGSEKLLNFTEYLTSKNFGLTTSVKLAQIKFAKLKQRSQV